MRLFALSLGFVLTLAACGQPEEPPPIAEAPAARPEPWFICDGIDAPNVIVFERAEGSDDTRVAMYGKPNGEILERHGLTIGAEEGAAGSVVIPLMVELDDAGHVTRTNPGVLDNPASVYTPRFTSAQLFNRNTVCRWLPRTRVMGFTGRRSFVIHEDADGDLIYTAYNFTDAAGARQIELSDNGRSTTFSAEVRGGAETVAPSGADFRFENEGYTYSIVLEHGVGRIDVWQGGELVQTEPLIAFVTGDASAAAEPAE